MKITHATHQYWLKRFEDSPLAGFSKSNREKLKSAIKAAPEAGISADFSVLTEADIEWFVPLYDSMLSGKRNPFKHDIHGSTLGKAGAEYWILKLSSNGIPIGATIFSVKDWYVSIAFRTYPNSWPDQKLRAAPALYADYAISEHALSLNMNALSHGLDRNPYGPNSHIGLAIFKLSVGCKPHIPVTPEFTEIETDNITESTLLLLQPETGRVITDAKLFLKREDEERYAQVCKYPELLRVEVNYID